MRLYHGTDKLSALSIVYDGVDLNYGRKYLDFGQGFYMTLNFNQAEQWAKRNKYPCVLEFELDITELVIKEFKKPDYNWAKFVVENRFGIAADISYDCIIGPMADGKIAFLHKYWQKKKITKEQAIQNIIGKSNGDQVAALKEKAIKALKYIRRCEYEQKR